MLRQLLVLAPVLAFVSTSSPRPERIWQPPSAHAALVRVVEAVAAFQPDAATVEIHGAASTYRPPDTLQRETVRVRLQVVVLAATAQAAEAHLAGLRARLALQPWIGTEEARAEAVTYDQVRSVYNTLEWVPGFGQKRPEGAIVLEGTLEVDVDPRGFDPEFVEGEGEVEDWGRYIREVAQQKYVNVGALDLRFFGVMSVVGTHDDVYRIRPAGSGNLLSRVHVGNLLFQLENVDPRAQVTAIELEHVDGDLWTLAAEVTVRRSG